MGLKARLSIIKNRLNKKNNTAEGMIWTFAERISAQLVSTIVGIVLARMLLPNDYGIISIVMVFITICNVFVTRGFGTTLVQKKDADDLDYSTAFYLSVFLGFFLYVILFAIAPFIAGTYKMEQLTPVLRVLGIRIPIAAFNTIQQAYIQRTMQFRIFFVATLTGTIVSCVTGIVMAYCGYGVWALVGQYLTNVIIDTVILSFVSGWRLKTKFSFARVRYIWSFGGKILFSDLLCTIVDNFRNLITGKVFGSQQLAFLDQGNKYPKLLTSNINTSIQKVMLSSFSRKQDDLQNLKDSLRNGINMGTFVVTPVLIGFMGVSEKFVRVILTDKWLPAVPFICIACAGYLSRPFETMAHQAILAVGHSDMTLKMLIFTNCVDIIFTLTAVICFRNIKFMAFTVILTEICSTVISGMVTRRLFKYGIREQLIDTVPYFVSSVVMGIAVYFIGHVLSGGILILLIQIVAGILIYATISFAYQFKACRYLKTIFERKVRKSPTREKEYE